MFTGTLRQQRQGLADPADESGQGEHSVGEDSERSQPVRSGVGTVPGRTAGLEDGHTLAGRGRIEYLWKEQEGNVWCAGNRCVLEEATVAHPPSGWRCYGGQETFDNLELLHANCHRQIHARAKTDGTNRVLRGTLGKA